LGSLLIPLNYSREGKGYRFSIDEDLSENFNESVEETEIDEDIRKAFEEENVTLDEEAEIVEIEEGVWEIDDDESERYRIEKDEEDDELKVYGYQSYEYYIENWEDVGARNLVASVLADWRAYDTMGEAIVLITAILGFYIILKGGEDDEDVYGD